MPRRGRPSKTIPASAPKLDEEKTPSVDKSIAEPESKVLSSLEKLKQDTDILLMLYPKNEDGYFTESIESQDEITVYNLIKEKKDFKDKLFILLDTSGGNVYAAVKIMDCLRSKYQDITIGIAQDAKSSGTMMCFAANKLIMSPISELGPLDKPLQHPDNENAYISALDIVKSIDGTLDTAEIRQTRLATNLSKKFGMRLKSSFELSNNFISNLIAPMLAHEDIKIYNQAKRLLAIAETYGKEFLGDYMFKDMKNVKIKDRLISIIIRQFVWLYPDHAFAVRRNDLRDFLFNVEDSENFDYWPDLWKEFERNKSIKVITFL